MSIREKPQTKEELSFGEILNSAPENKTIQEALGKCYHLVKNHDHIIASISGGSDSDIMLDMLIRCGGADKTKFVFFNTGLEYEATKRHIQDLNELYGIQIIDTPPPKTYSNLRKGVWCTFLEQACFRNDAAFAKA